MTSLRFCIGFAQIHEFYEKKGFGSAWKVFIKRVDAIFVMLSCCDFVVFPVAVIVPWVIVRITAENVLWV